VGTAGQETAGAVAGRERYFSTEARDFGHGNGVINISCVQPNNDAMGEMPASMSKPYALREGWEACAMEDVRPKALAACLSAVDGRGSPSHSEYRAT
jgi:hypothetical protein